MAVSSAENSVAGIPISATKTRPGFGARVSPGFGAASVTVAIARTASSAPIAVSASIPDGTSMDTIGLPVAFIAAMMRGAGSRNGGRMPVPNRPSTITSTDGSIPAGASLTRIPSLAMVAVCRATRLPGSFAATIAARTAAPR